MLNNEHIPVSNKIYPVFTARCYAEHCIATACVCPSLRNVEVSWSHWLEFFENDFTVRAYGVSSPQTLTSRI